jgi:ferredoxin--NADP+ reductase
VLQLGCENLTHEQFVAELGDFDPNRVKFLTCQAVEDEFAACAETLTVMTDDGSYGRKGTVTLPLAEALERGETFDEVIAIGPLVMMKYVSLTTKPYGVKTIVSMNPVMIDGTGMCGGCRLTVGGKVKFACVDGPEFDGHEVDFDEAMRRSRMYGDFEAHAREASCNLLRKGEETNG